jgi:uncharacterized surface protein with fasciclin (FAS1) repeats
MNDLPYTPRRSADAVPLLVLDNETFAKLPEGTILNRLEDIDKMKTVLTYRFVPQKLTASDLRKQKSVITMQAERSRSRSTASCATR